MARTRVALFFGGRSSEHTISCATAAGVLAALAAPDSAGPREQVDLIAVGITPTGQWVLTSAEPSRWQISASQPHPQVSVDDGVLVHPATDTPGTLTLLNGTGEPVAIADVAFPLLHGPYGEDGTIQGLLDLLLVRYVGSGVFTSAAAMDKRHMKTVLTGSGIPVAPWLGVTAANWRRDPAATRSATAALGWPVFTKPARGGSSIGITKVAGPGELDAAIEAALAHDSAAVIEAAISGRELECAVLEAPDGAVQTTRPAEVTVTGAEFYDYETKYFNTEAFTFTWPAPVGDEVAARVRELSAAVFTAFGCEGLARVDCFLTTSGEVLINEVNTMPGFTHASGYPQMWAGEGLSYSALVRRLVDLAAAKAPGLQ